MTDLNDSLPPLPPHIGTIIRLMARLRSEHHQNAKPIQRAIEHLTALISRPRFMGMLMVAVACWVSVNLSADALGYHAFDPPPFFALQGVISLVSLFMIVAIVATQRREDQLAQLHEQLNLQLAILNEQKTAKVIELLEELRRDDPFVKDRIDQEAEVMAKSANPSTVIRAIKETGAEMLEVEAGQDDLES
jgi:uncharacterized membrane protein